MISIVLIFAALMLILLYTAYKEVEGFVPLGDIVGDYPVALDNVLVQDIYPITGKNGVSTETSNKMWYHYPIFEVGSYKQITNNLKYPNNPDTGRCMPADVCGALYKEFQKETNYIDPLPPVNPDCSNSARVGYFLTDVNMLPFRNDEANVMY